MTRPDYSFGGLLELTGKHNPVQVEHSTVARRFEDSVFVAYQSRPLAVLSKSGVMPYTTADISREAKRRLNSILKPYGWALVTRRGHNFMLFKATQSVHPADSSHVLLPNGDRIRVQATQTDQASK